MTENKFSVLKKINAIYKEISHVTKGATVGYGRNSYKAVQHDDVTNLLHDPITNAGLVCIPNVTDCTMEFQEYKTKDGIAHRFVCNTWVELQVICSDTGGSIKTKSFAMAFDSQDKAPGKAYSMALKYCYLKLFMLASGDDEEQRMEEPQGQIKANNYKPSVNTNVNPDLISPAQKGLLWNLMKEKKLVMSDLCKPVIEKMKPAQASKLIEGMKEVRDQNQFDNLIFKV